MSFPAGTILERAVPIVDDEYGLNKVRIVGPSPVRAELLPLFAGDTGDLVITAPVDTFAANQIVPEVALQRDYEVISYPPEDTLVVDPVQQQKEQRARLESPEDVFARATRDDLKGKATAKAARRAAT